MAQVQQQPHFQPKFQESNAKFSNDASNVSKQQDHNLKCKATDSEEVEQDSENEVVDLPEIKRAKMEYLKSLYHGNKQQAELEMEVQEGGDKEAEIQKKKFKEIWRNANMLKP